MPVYNYKCDNCGDIKEAIARMEEEEKYIKCKCFLSNTKLPHKRMLSLGSTFILAGRGWANDKYNKPLKKKGKS